MLALSMFPAGVGAAWGQDQNQNDGPPPQQGYGPPPQQGYGAPPPPDDQAGAPSNYQPFGPDQIDQLVAPIALYPDSLVAQILAAATYPAQVASAQQFIQQSGNYPPEQLAELANTQPWDPSVKSLVAFPQVVNDLNRNIGWTTQLGNAYYNQPQDVLSAVQVMRQRAYEAGTLRPTQQLAVDYAPGDIVIEPVNPAVVYVPYYNPWVVYGAPVPVYGHYYYGGPPAGVIFGAGLAIGFGVGLAIGAFSHFAWGFHSWAPNWGAHTVVFNHNTYISRSVTVINHGNYGGFDRNPQARAFNQQQSRFVNASNHTTINNVTVNRGGNTFNNGGNTVNRGGNTFNNGGTTNYNRGGNTFNNGGNTSYNRGGSTFHNGGTPSNSTGFNRGGQPGTPGAPTAGQQQLNAARPQQQYARPAGQPQQQHYTPQTQHNQPQHNSNNGHQSQHHDSGGHDDHH